jgi:hypothetical protein
MAELVDAADSKSVALKGAGVRFPSTRTSMKADMSPVAATTPLGSAVTSHQDCFGDAFLLAVASVAGCAISNRRPDDDSIDWTLSCKLDRRPKLDVQMKTTSTDDGKGDFIRYPLKRKNYDDLIIADLTSPRVLIVVIIPDNPNAWLRMPAEQLVLCYCAYWVSLRGREPTENANTVTVQIPRINLFTPDALVAIMKRINSGDEP